MYRAFQKRILDLVLGIRTIQKYRIFLRMNLITRNVKHTPNAHNPSTISCTQTRINIYARHNTPDGETPLDAIIPFKLSRIIGRPSIHTRKATVRELLQLWMNLRRGSKRGEKRVAKGGGSVCGWFPRVERILLLFALLPKRSLLFFHRLHFFFLPSLDVSVFCFVQASAPASGLRRTVYDRPGICSLDSSIVHFIF